MPKRIRRVINRLKSKGRHDETQPRGTAPDQDSTNLLGIPPEIRNLIYDHLANDTTLLLHPSKDRKPPPPVGLLLACRQTHREYRTILFSQAQFLITVTDYNFGNLVRVLEKLSERDVSELKQNCRLWILINIGHAPTRDDRRKLKGWCDYRANDDAPPYFGPGRKAAGGLIFEYDVKFANQIRPLKPMSRYANGYQMKLDIIRSHLRMFSRLQIAEEGKPEDEELKRLYSNITECAEMFEELQVQRLEQSTRSVSGSTGLSGTEETTLDRSSSI